MKLTKIEIHSDHILLDGVRYVKDQWSSDLTAPETKELRDKIFGKDEEACLLAEAKKRYPIGSKYLFKDVEYIVESDNFHKHPFVVGSICAEYGKGLLYDAEKFKWAEII